MREIVNGTFYVMRAGCAWRLMPSDLPPWRTIYRWFAAWRDDGCFERINHALVMADRERVGRSPNERPGIGETRPCPEPSPRLGGSAEVPCVYREVNLLDHSPPGRWKKSEFGGRHSSLDRQASG